MPESEAAASQRIQFGEEIHQTKSAGIYSTSEISCSFLKLNVPQLLPAAPDILRSLDIQGKTSILIENLCLVLKDAAMAEKVASVDLEQRALQIADSDLNRKKKQVRSFLYFPLCISFTIAIAMPSGDMQ